MGRGGRGRLIAQGDDYMDQSGTTDNRERACHTGLERSPLKGVYLEVVPAEFHYQIYLGTRGDGHHITCQWLQKRGQTAPGFR